jgi:hypothetical protein
VLEASEQIERELAGLVRSSRCHGQRNARLPTPTGELRTSDEDQSAASCEPRDLTELGLRRSPDVAEPEDHAAILLRIDVRACSPEMVGSA